MNRDEFKPIYAPWGNGGWYVLNVRYPSGAFGCVSRNYPDQKWRIVCDPRAFDKQPTFDTRDEAAFAEYELTAKTSSARLSPGTPMTDRPRTSSSNSEVPAGDRSKVDVLRFEWRIRGLGTEEYEVFGDGPSYRIELRFEATAYQRSIFNGDEIEWRRDVVAAVGLVWRSCGPDRPLPQRVVDEFNAWRALRHATAMHEICSQPQRYLPIAKDDPHFAPPPVVRGAHYEIGKGWTVHAEPPMPSSGALETPPPTFDTTEWSP